MGNIQSTALAHHWLINSRGGEKVLEEFCVLFPEAGIHTLVADRSLIPASLRKKEIRCSLLQLIPGATRLYKQLLPLHPWAFANMRVPRGTRLVLSTDAGMVKGLKVPDGVPHVCYCHSPPRYLWDMQGVYLDNSSTLGSLSKFVFAKTAPYLQQFDLNASKKVTHFIANSRFVQQRIASTYGRESTVINPPVSLDDFVPDGEREDFYLVISQLVPYKRIDLAVDAFNQLGKRLVVIGAGSELKSLKSKAKSNIQFLGSQPFKTLLEHYQRCRAFIFPGVEDFGITPLEAQACGRPVIAYGEGGALETVVDGVTGIFFKEQTSEALQTAVLDLESRIDSFSVENCRANAERFSQSRFREEIRSFLDEHVFSV